MNPNQEDAISILAQCGEGSLATLEGESPFNSVVSFLYRGEPEGLGKCYVLMSGLARHTKNVQKNSRVSLLVVKESSDFIYQRPRVSAQGEIVKIMRDATFENLKQVYVKKFPQAAIFFNLPDFDFYKLNIQELHYIGGFGKAEVIRA